MRKVLYKVMASTMPMPVRSSGCMGTASSTTPTTEPKSTPTIWAMHERRESVKVGSTAAMAPSMAKISREVVVP